MSLYFKDDLQINEADFVPPALSWQRDTYAPGFIIQFSKY